MNVKEKNQGIELLRIIAMLMVMTLHILGHGGVLQESINKGILQELVYCSTEIICYPATNIFVLISGYVSNSNEVNIKSIISRWIQVFFYSSFIAFFVYCIGKYDVSVYGNFTENFFPILFSKYWFFTAYFALMFISPFINVSIEKIENRDLKKLLLIIFILFSFMSLLVDPFNMRKGYSFVWFVVLYTIGRIIKKNDFLHNVETKHLVLIIVALFVITMLPYAILKKGILTNYVSPTVLFQAICYVILFSRLKIKNRIVSYISPFVFGSYLLQDNTIIRALFILDKMVFINELNVVIGFLTLCAFSCLFLLLGVLVEKIRVLLFKVLKIDIFISFISKKIEEKLTTLVTH